MLAYFGSEPRLIDCSGCAEFRRGTGQSVLRVWQRVFPNKQQRPGRVACPVPTPISLAAGGEIVSLVQ